MSEYPTAHTSLEDSATTPFTMLSFVVALGLGMILHCCPSQCSTSVVSPSSPQQKCPAVHISDAERAEMSQRSLKPSPTFGLGTMLHWVPSQCSISVPL